MKFRPMLALAATCLLSVPVAAAPPVTALAYAPDGTRLAAGLRGRAVVLNSADGVVVKDLTDLPGQVTAVAWHRLGRMLGMAAGKASKVGELYFYEFPPPGAHGNARQYIRAHDDLIQGMTFCHEMNFLATCSYDRLVKIWDPIAGGGEVQILKDHSDAVYGVAFRPDGKLLASAGADRTVKIWDLDTGKRLYSLNDSTDWVYAVAWSPDGRRVAAAGVDKSIRLWNIGKTEGKLALSAFGHEQPVLKLAFTADGATLFSVGEDRIVKAWDAATLKEKMVYPAQPETVLSFAVRPDGKQFAVGRYDGALLLIDAESGKTVAQPLPEKPKPPKVGKVTPDALPLGAKVMLTFDGEHLAGVAEAISTPPGIKLTGAAPGSGPGRVARLIVEAPKTLAPGPYQVKLKGPAGESNAVTLHVDRFAARPEPAGTDSPRTAPALATPLTVAGGLSRAGEVDHYRIDLKAGEEVGVQAQAAAGSKVEPVLALEDAEGRLLVETTNGSLGHRAATAGAYVLSVRDREYRGGAEFRYRLHVGAIPVVTSHAPLSVPRGGSVVVAVRGVFLGGEQSREVRAPADAAVGSKVPVPVASPHGTVLNAPALVVGEFPQVGAGRPLPVPGSAAGVIPGPGATEAWRFAAKKGQPLIVEVEARRIGSELDSVIEILDSSGKPVERAVLRSVARSFVTFRDHDSAGPGIRMETWNEFAIDDYVLVGQELMRIKALPKNPDDDCQFYAVGGQRVGYLGTTPSFHAMNTPMFKVSIHPPGTTFPPNGMPLVTVYYRNDDGGPGYGKDSRLRFEPPADGAYQVRVSDARGQGGPNHAYRLTVRPPRPDFSVSFNPTAPAVWKGGAIPITVTANRTDEFDGPIQIRLENLPPGFSAPPTFIEAGQLSTTFALFAEPGAAGPGAKQSPLKLVATATIDGKDVTHEASGGLPKAVEPGDIVTTTAQQVVTVKSGQETRMLVRVERRNGFKGRIPLEVQGLPHGVRVLHIGLNGILVTERDNSREVFLYAEPWVKPMEHPFVVLAKREGKNTEHAAKSVLLKVEK